MMKLKSSSKLSFSKSLTKKNHSKKRLVIALSVAVAVCAVAGGTVLAATIGSEDDPLVSKSYVDNKIEQVLTLINGNGTTTSASVDTDAIVSEAVSEVMEQINSGDLTGGSVAVDGYAPVSVAVGQTIYGGEGTELILRAGKGRVVISGEDGIADITTGNELKSGSTVTKNHLLIVPRSDDRGVKVSEAAWFLVKGTYEIK
jgi:hypothetical protein